MTKHPTSSAIREFCERHNISEASYYRHKPDMPRAIKIGGQYRIVDEDEASWIAAKQAAADPLPAPRMGRVAAAMEG